MEGLERLQVSRGEVVALDDGALLVDDFVHTKVRVEVASLDILRGWRWMRTGTSLVRGQALGASAPCLSRQTSVSLSLVFDLAGACSRLTRWKSSAALAQGGSLDEGKCHARIQGRRVGCKRPVDALARVGTYPKTKLGTGRAPAKRRKRAAKRQISLPACRALKRAKRTGDL